MLPHSFVPPVAQVGLTCPAVDEHLQVLPHARHLRAHPHLAVPGADVGRAVGAQHQAGGAVAEGGDRAALAEVAVVAGVVQPEAAVEGHGDHPLLGRGEAERRPPPAAGVAGAGVEQAAHQRGVHAEHADHVRGVLTVGAQCGHLHGRAPVRGDHGLPAALTRQRPAAGERGERGVAAAAERAAGLLGATRRRDTARRGAADRGLVGRVAQAFQPGDEAAETVVAAPLGELRHRGVVARRGERPLDGQPARAQHREEADDRHAQRHPPSA